MALSGVVSGIFNVEKCRDLEIGVKGHSRSWKVVWFPLVNLSLKRTVFDILDLYVYRDLETRVTGHSRSSKMIPFDPAPTTSY